MQRPSSCLKVSILGGLNQKCTTDASATTGKKIFTGTPDYPSQDRFWQIIEDHQVVNSTSSRSSPPSFPLLPPSLPPRFFPLLLLSPVSSAPFALLHSPSVLSSLSSLLLSSFSFVLPFLQRKREARVGSERQRREEEGGFNFAPLQYPDSDRCQCSTQLPQLFEHSWNGAQSISRSMISGLFSSFQSKCICADKWGINLSFVVRGWTNIDACSCSDTTCAYDADVILFLALWEYSAALESQLILRPGSQNEFFRNQKDHYFSPILRIFHARFTKFKLMKVVSREYWGGEVPDSGHVVAGQPNCRRYRRSSRHPVIKRLRQAESWFQIFLL